MSTVDILLADEPEETTNLLPRRPAPGLHDALDQFTRRAMFLDGGGDIAETQAPGVPDETSGAHVDRHHNAAP